MHIYIKRNTLIFVGITAMILPGIIGFTATVGVAIVVGISFGLTKLITGIADSQHKALPHPEAHPEAQPMKLLAQPVDVRWPKMIAQKNEYIQTRR